MKKTLLTIILIHLFTINFYGQKKAKKAKKAQKSEKQLVLGLNAQIADQNYYSKAVLEYKLIKEILKGFSTTTQLLPHDEPALFLEKEFLDPLTQNQFLIKHGKPTVTIFPNLNEQKKQEEPNRSEKFKNVPAKLSEKGVESCRYVLPKKPEDLTSGFQFNHYFFHGENKAAMQAFGIVDSQYDQESMFIVTDYIQYKDCDCTGIPTIRYAIGLRSEFKISKISADANLTGISSLAGLAAQAETNNMKVNITVKTIGITGLDSKANIPNNTSFDVSTYKDYQDVIKFIKEFDKEKKGLSIHPEIIPVMDEYRTTLSHSFEPLYSKIEQLEEKLLGLSKQRKKRKKNKDDRVNVAFDTIDAIKIKAIQDEIKAIKKERKILSNVNERMNSYERFYDILKIIQKGS
ncbi:hypothetical protein [Aquimarina sediminis]|uniref:hypothetical protein n=1 Tax=Aquimarina sediminis TaxID=2070536 RepID=UPI000CA071E4|nr:hypothetical protein [Aquimarina sediminis]